jgi:hypothetical protein
MLADLAETRIFMRWRLQKPFGNAPPMPPKNRLERRTQLEFSAAELGWVVKRKQSLPLLAAAVVKSSCVLFSDRMVQKDPDLGKIIDAPVGTVFRRTESGYMPGE